MLRFKILYWAEYGSTQQLHIAAKNYVRNYTTGQPLNQRITYERALRNLIVLMFSHYVNHIENTGSLEGHRTLMAHECLSVAAKLGWFHQWQRWVEPGDRDKPDWMQVPVVSAGDFRQVQPTLDLLGNVQHPAYAHPKLLGRCYDNVYYQGQLIGDLPTRGKPPTKAHTQKIYNQEYKEVVAQVENTLDLTDESPTYPVLLTDPEKIELKEKPYHWIPAWVNRLDPKDYVEEIHSFRNFNQKSKTFALEVIAIADWGRKCFDVGLHSSVPPLLV